MKTEPWVEIKMEVPLSAVDFSDCGDGCGHVQGLDYAKFKGVRIMAFSPESRAAAQNRMLVYLGERDPDPVEPVRPALVGRHCPDQADIQAFREEVLAGDLVANNRRAG